MGAAQNRKRLKYFKANKERFRKEPFYFAQKVLGFEADKWQKNALASLAASSKVAVKSGQGVGKTGIEAVAMLWFLCCFPYSRVVATAPTRQQLHDVLWAEAYKWIGNSPLLSDILAWTKTRISLKKEGERWFAVARTATRPENMQGYHENNMLFIVDEASGVADPIMEAILGTLSGVNNKLLMCGNPTRTSGTFFDAFNADRSQYCLLTVSSRDSARTSKENIEALERKYGKDSNVVRVRVDGLFPRQEDDVFIRLDWLEGSVSTELSEATAKALGEYTGEDGHKAPRDSSGVEVLTIGCDVARFGGDKTCIGYRVNEVVRFYAKYSGQDTTWTASKIVELYRLMRRWYPDYKKPIFVRVDDGGVGGGVIDQLRSFKRCEPSVYEGMEITPVNFGRRLKHRYYDDSTTYMMGVVRDLISPFDEEGREKEPEIILPNDNDLIGQLSCRKYAFTSNAKQRVESKEEMKKRGLSSPDEADCVLLVCLPVKEKHSKRER